MATSKDDMKHGTAQARVTGDDMLRTGYVNGTPLEAGKIADSDPVDLFSAAGRVAALSSQEEQPRRGEEEAGKIAESEPVDLFSSAGRVADQAAHAAPPQEKGRRGMADQTGGGRRLQGRQT